MAMIPALMCAAMLVAQSPAAAPRVLPTEVGFALLGSYVLDEPTSTGLKELAFTLVDGQPQIRLGEAESRLIFGGTALETTGDGVKTDVYKFTVEGKPGVQVLFKVSGGRFAYLLWAEDLPTPPLMITGKRKRR